MSAYKENFQEQKSRFEYSREHFWILFLGSSLIAFFIVYFLFDSEESFALSYIVNFPRPSRLSFYLSGGALLMFVRWWWRGLPFYLLYFVNRIKFLKNHIPQHIIDGKRKTLENFFYQPSVINDEIPRISNLTFLSRGEYDIMNYFNFNPYTLQKDKDGTSRIILLFRDKKRERIVGLSKSKKNKERQKRGIAQLAAYDRRFIERGVVTEAQEKLYLDLFQSIEGIIASYGDIVNKDIPSPLTIVVDKKTKKLKSFNVNENITVFDDGTIYFSIKMIVDTTQRVSVVFATFLMSQVTGNSRVHIKYGNIVTQGNNIEKIIDIFKLVFLRRLLLNYGSVPAGWLVGRIEDYDLRAILSAVDREMVPTITTINDGSNKDFSSDVFASMFLFIYWSFMKNHELVSTIEGVDWCFNTVKDVSEQQARDLASQNKMSERADSEFIKKQMKTIEKEIENAKEKKDAESRATKEGNI